MECDFWQAIRMFDNPLENFLVDTISYTAQKKVKCVQRKLILTYLPLLANPGKLIHFFEILI